MKRLKNDFFLRLFQRLLRDIYLKKGKLFSYWIRPQNIDGYELENHFITDEKVAIVIQGPIIEDNDFTLESMKLYKRTCPGVGLIISTWNNTDADLLKRFELEGGTVVTSKLPDKFYGTNILRQSESTISGIKKAEELGFSYVIKTRSDQRMYANDLIPYIFALLNLYGKDRIVTCDCNMFFNHLYDLNDMWNFGTIENMKSYWDLSDFETVFSDYDKDMIKENDWPETILFAHYLKKKKHKLKWSIDDTYKCFAKYAIVVNSNIIDLNWTKTRTEFLKKTYSSKEYDDFTARHWMILYDREMRGSK